MSVNYPNGKPYVSNGLMPEKKKNKYHAKKMEVDGHLFDSTHEAIRYGELRLLHLTGKIQNLRLQVPYLLIPKSEYGGKIEYIADFVYEENGETIIEDAKGVRTPVYRLKKRLIAELYGIRIKET